MHVGTHKTGTSALQAYLGANDLLLASQGFLYPKCGRWSPAMAGQHNVAMEISDDERFDRTLGTLAELLAEMRLSTLPAACISSEAFQFVHDRPERLARLRDGIRSAGYEPVLVVYLRSQSEYLESLYGTLVNHGYHLSFRRYFQDALATGVVRYREVRSYRFDYDALLAHYASVFGESNTVARPYAQNEDPGALLRDFFTTIGLDERTVADSVPPPERLNTRRDLLQVMRRLLSNAGVVPGDATQRLMRLCESLQPNGSPTAFRPLDEEDAVALNTRFEAGNRQVRERWGVAVEAATLELQRRRRSSSLDPLMQAGRALMRSVESDLAPLTL